MMVITKTPLRISFFGGGTDYPVWYRDHGGAVISTTIDKYQYITARYLPPFFDHKTLVVWSKIEKVKDHQEIEHPSVRACLMHLGIDEGLGVHFDADLPARIGLGSSSAFTVGFLNALHALRYQSITPQDLAREAIHIEQNVIPEAVGSQDQTAAAFGGLNHIEFGGPEEIKVTPVSMQADRYGSLQSHCMMFFTGFHRSAPEIASYQIKNTPNKERELNEMHRLVEEARAVLMRSGGNLDDFGKLLHESWMLKRSLTEHISNDTIDGIYNTARGAGALGGKLLGAGAGGFFLVFARPEDQPKIKESLKGLQHVPIQFDTTGSQVIHKTV